MAIRYIRQKDISYTKWDKCIDSSLNGNTYALSWHLEIVAPMWDAIVEDDYVSVMPLICRRKNFQLEIFSPQLSGQLGVFSGKPVNYEKLHKFCDVIPKKFRKISIYLNRQNSSTFKHSSSLAKSIFELDLISPFKKVQRNYSPEILESLQLAEKHKYWVMKHLSLNELDKYFINQAQEHKEFYKTKVKRIISHLIHLNRAEISGVYSPQNMLCAIACYVKSNNNVILLFAHSDTRISSIKTTHLLLNSFFENYSARNITLSFDHRDDNWNANLYSSFGAIETYSNCIFVDRRLRFLRWIS